MICKGPGGGIVLLAPDGWCGSKFEENIPNDYPLHQCQARIICKLPIEGVRFQRALNLNNYFGLYVCLSFRTYVVTL